MLGDSLSQQTIDIYGHSLANFIDEPGGTGKGQAPKEILGLQGQISHVEGLLLQYIDNVNENAQIEGKVKQLKVVITGHSVGAYIGLEVLKRWRERGTGKESENKVCVVGFIGLWPTVTWIGKSPNGIRFGWLAQLPGLPQILATLAKFLTIVLPQQVLYILVKLITGMTDKAAKVTTEFICSTRGVEQALYMAHDELLQITEDRWDEDLWGTAVPKSGIISPKLILYFGKQDHWVANHTRDELIAARAYRNRGGEDWKPKMLVDDAEIPHSFCIHHNLTVAEKVKGFIEEIIAADQAQCGP
ncbi:hypothetical protein MMC13_007378 [Lambiella insularis]|nr:hypothetical protein [Lambiella insularis]